MTRSMADNAKQSFKCRNCGRMFAVEESSGICPGCGQYCTVDSCRVVDASDEGF